MNWDYTFAGSAPSIRGPSEELLKVNTNDTATLTCDVQDDQESEIVWTRLESCDCRIGCECLLTEDIDMSFKNSFAEENIMTGLKLKFT